MPEHIIAFARALRTCGVPVGPAQVLQALRCVQAVGVRERVDVYWSLRAALVSRPEEGLPFDRVFDMYFRDMRALEVGVSSQASAPASQRAQEAEDAPRRGLDGEEPAASVPAMSIGRGACDREVLSERDFARMSDAELVQARAAIASLLPALPRRPSRRQARSFRGSRVDLRATLRRARRYGGEPVELVPARTAYRDLPIVLLCDVSGSMAAYSRMFLHFAHALTSRRHQVSSFVFSTRLSNVTRELREHDPDRAIERVSGDVRDWSGGTRIAGCLGEFNQQWARRVLADRALLVLLSDGLERETSAQLGLEAARLGRKAHRWIWLNPLLRYGCFEPRAAGICALLPHVDELRPAHNLHFLESLATLLFA